MRVGVDRTKYAIQIPLPPKIDPTVSLMTVEDKPDVTYDEVGGAKESLEKLREVVELPLLHPERFLTLGIDPPKGVLLYGPPGTGKTSTILAAAKDMYGAGYKSMTLELNASDDRGIDVVRDQIKEFAGTRRLFSKGIKLIILDEADMMTKDAQFAPGPRNRGDAT